MPPLPPTLASGMARRTSDLLASWCLGVFIKQSEMTSVEHWLPERTFCHASLMLYRAQVHSSAELDGVLHANPDKLVVLMCKAMACRPCKVRPRCYPL